MNTAVADDNRDRAVYREVAVANSHPEWKARSATWCSPSSGSRARVPAGGYQSGRAEQK